MSDPVTNTDIEDVLSSIRRLVSNAQDTDREDMPQDGAAERLVLSPALRIDRTAHGGHDRTIAEDQGTSGSTLLSPQIPPDESETNAADAQDAETLEECAPDETRDAVGPEWSAAHDAEPGAEAETETASSTPDSLGQQAADFEAMITDHDEQWEHDDVPDVSVPEPDAADPLDWQDEPIQTAEAPTSQDPDDAEADAAASQTFEDAWAAERDGAPDRTFSGTDDFDFDDTVLDEDALRDLVADIVRQELQGALGERITRNVRKLVRREIHRALTSQNFD